VIWPDLRQSFEVKPEEFFKGKAVCIFGKIETFKDKPQLLFIQKIKFSYNNFVGGYEGKQAIERLWNQS
jgi:hypothetical protein